MEYTIIHNVENQSFEAEVDGYKAQVEYSLMGGSMIIMHTWVPQPIEGRGIAAELTKYALEYAKKYNLKVLPGCSYTQAYIKRHNEYEALL